MSAFGGMSLAEFVERISDAYFALDREWRVTYANPRALRLAGLEREQVLGRRLDELIAGGLSPAFAEGYEHAFATGETVHFEALSEAFDRWLDVSVYPTREGIGVFFRDITERKRAEEELRESRELYRLVVENSLDLISLLDADLRIVYASPSHERILGYTPEELRDTYALDLLDPEQVPAALAALREGDASAPSDRIPELLRTRHRDGRRRLLEGQATLLRGAAGEQLFLTTARDVTDRVLAEQAARRSEERYRLIVESSPDGIVAIDADLRIVFANERMAELVGTTVGDLVGADALTLVAREDRETAKARFARHRAGDGDRYELRLRRSDGSQLDALLSAVPLPGDAGELTGALVLVSDLTERRRLEAEVRQAQKLEAVGRLAGGVAHEFNNRLLVIRGYATLALGREGARDAELRDDLEQIVAAAEGAKALTQGLLAFSRKQVLNPRELDLNDVVRGTIKLVAPLLGAAIEVEEALEPRLRPVRADPRQLEQVVLNLALNARDAMPGGGTLTVATANVDGDDGPAVALTVSDTGTGIAEEAKAELFEPFFTTKPVGEGTGLGLATVYGIVQQSGGRIAVESEPGRGASFTIRLPAAQEGAGEAEAADREAPPATGETILLVEDDEQVRDLVRSLLERQGYEVVAVADAEEAVEAAAEHAVDLLLTDVVMPGASGTELARRLGPAAPRVLYMSGYTREGQDASPLLPKPFTPAELGEAVRAALATQP